MLASWGQGGPLVVFQLQVRDEPLGPLGPSWAPLSYVTLTQNSFVSWMIVLNAPSL